MTQKQNKRRSRPLIILSILVLIFVVPFSIALVMYKGHHILGRLINNGELIKPPFSVTLLKLRDEKGKLLNNSTIKNKKSEQPTTNGKWMLILFNGGLCEKDCQRSLYDLHQIRAATGKNRERIERVLLTYPSHKANKVSLNVIISERFPGTQHLTIKEQQFNSVIHQHVKAKYALESGTIYLVDPIGNVIMTYAPGTSPDDIYKDMKRLLKVSQIG